jgi:hypothetical protein
MIGRPGAGRRRGGAEAEPAGEHGQALEQPPLGLREQIPAPVGERAKVRCRGRAARARDDELPTEPVAQGLLGDELTQLAGDQGMAARREVRVGAYITTEGSGVPAPPDPVR